MKLKLFFLLMATALTMGFVACGDDDDDLVINKPGAINERNFPDAKFREWLMSQPFGKDSVLTEEEIANVTSIDVSNLGIKSLQGIEAFKALVELNCNGNQLIGLKFPDNPNLTILRCWNSQLPSLDVSANTKLKQLWCGNNKLEVLNVSQNLQLEILSCHTNRLTSLDLSQNKELSELYFYSNQIRGSDMGLTIKRLNKPEHVAPGYLYAIYRPNERNLMSVSNVEAAKAKGWKVLYSEGNDWLDYAGERVE